MHAPATKARSTAVSSQRAVLLVQDAHPYRSWAFCASFHVFFVKEYRFLAELHAFKVVVFGCCNI
jgi:hypothetical protein